MDIFNWTSFILPLWLCTSSCIRAHPCKSCVLCTMCVCWLVQVGWISIQSSTEPVIQSAQFGPESNQGSHLVTNQGPDCDDITKRYLSLMVTWATKCHESHQTFVLVKPRLSKLHGHIYVRVSRLWHALQLRPECWVTETRLLWFVCL